MPTIAASRSACSGRTAVSAAKRWRRCRWCIILTFAVLAFRAHKPIVAAGLGLIVGGALGNIADRLGMGAVFDFLVVRLGAIPFFVCNSADIFISLGVMVLGYDMLLVEIQRRRDAAAHPSTGSG